ncbi:Protein FMC1-like protein [Aphelenchoides bicaudatus]|nr:Protein FMC1-like protein [Aphelenchoides bicaudatus]
MISTIERSRTAIATLRKIVHELKLANGKLNRDSQQYNFLIDQFREHQLTQRIHCKAPNEAEHLAQTYLTYLESSRKLSELHEKYKGKQKTVEQSAELVGLKVPEKR